MLWPVRVRLLRLHELRREVSCLGVGRAPSGGHDGILGQVSALQMGIGIFGQLLS